MSPKKTVTKAVNPERTRKAKLKLVAREAPSHPGGYYRYQLADCVTFSPLDELVQDYGYDAQCAVLAYDEENSVEFEVLLIVSMEVDGKALVRFKGYTEHFDMLINPSDDFKFPGFESACAAFQKKKPRVLELNSVSSFEAIESAADSIIDDAEVVEFLEMDRWIDNANDLGNLDDNDDGSVGKRKYLISDDEAEEVRGLRPSKLTKSAKRSAMQFFSPLINDQDKNDGNYDDDNNDDDDERIIAVKPRKKFELKRKADDQGVEQVDSNDIFDYDFDNNGDKEGMVAEQNSERGSEAVRGSAKQQKRKKEKSGKISKDRFKVELLKTKAAKQGTKAWLAHLFFDPHKEVTDGYVCRYCFEMRKSPFGASNLVKHLEHKHKKEWQDCSQSSKLAKMQRVMRVLFLKSGLSQ